MQQDTKTTRTNTKMQHCSRAPNSDEQIKCALQVVAPLSKVLVEGYSANRSMATRGYAPKLISRPSLHFVIRR